MIIGIGVDIIEIERVVKAANNRRFLKICFTDNEILFCEKNKYRFASNFAVKEAVVKALGIGFSRFLPNAIEVLRDKNGKPVVILLDKAYEFAKKLNVTNIHVSISHNKENVVANVVLEQII